MKNRLVKHGMVVLLGALMSGCGLGQWLGNGFRVGPNYETPPAPIAEKWIDYQTPASQPAETVDPAQWWAVFHDPVLDSLMHDAYGQNLTLRQAGERIVEARAARDISIGNFFPQTQDLAGSHTVNKVSNRISPNTDFSRANTDQWLQNVQGGLNVSWELDFWGKFRRAIESSDASLEASVADYDDVMVMLLADVATSYINYRTFQERLFLAKQNAEIQRQAYELAQNNFKAGAATERDMQQAKQVYEQTRALIPVFEQGVRLANDSLCVLLGTPTVDLSSRLGESGVIPVAPAEVATGIPADLLRRRPDVRRAERVAAAQSAQIGVAQSDLYPHFSLNGTIGLNAEYIGGLWATPGSLAGGFGPSFRWDILNYGRIENSVKDQESRFREFIAAYQATVLEANREVEDALVTFTKTREEETYLENSVVAAERTVQITYDQYRAGAVDFTPVFLFEETLTQTQDAHAQAQGEIALSMVEIYRSIGGGWEAREKSEGIVGPAVPAPTTQRQPSAHDILTSPATSTRPATAPR